MYSLFNESMQDGRGCVGMITRSVQILDTGNGLPGFGGTGCEKRARL